jgi:hypothetical protein
MVPLLVELAHDHDRSVRGQVLVVLFNYESLRDPAWIPVLQRRIVEDSYQENRLQAALLLWDLAKDKRALPVIVRDLKNRDCIELEDVTMTIHDGGAALQRFARICTEAPEMMPAMLELARHPDVSQYGSACLFAGTQLGEKGTAILIACLENKEASVRTSAGLQLVGRGPKAKDAIPALVKCLNDPDQNMRWIARDALMAIDPARFKQLSVEQEGK